jgi:TolB-like protein/Tfp pilus assembly protein PilF
VREVFLSYARQDDAIARRVAKTLQAAGHDVWRDSQLPAHRAYSEVIETRLKEAKAVVVLWSKSAAQSQWVRAEADFARSEGKLAQASIDGVLPPMPFNQIQCADLKGWRGSASHPGWAKLKDSVATVIGGDESKPEPSSGQSRWRVPRARWLAAAVLLIIAAGFLVSRYVGGADDRPVVAVLPFESLDSRDESLVAGIWEDTRQAIGRNPQLLVLGPNTAREIAEKGGGTARKLADYLVEANVRSIGDRIRVSANLVRTEDGAEIWSKSFNRRLDDVFALQSEIAGEIEGYIRGRLAERGGVHAENIATSGEVYALYSDARAKIRKRDLLGLEEARDQLRQVVKMDPNFAPGWATLSVAEQLYGPSLRRGEVGFDPQKAEGYARRAIALAPNLAAGHSALGFALKRGPAAEAALQRAIRLDHNDFESVYWLANFYRGEGDADKALQLYSRAVEIEPVFWPAVLSKLDLLLERGDGAAAERERQRLASLGNPLLSALAGIEIAEAKGDLSEAARIGLALLRADPKQSQGIVGFPIFQILLQLGLEDEARQAFPPPAFGPLLGNNDPRGLDMVESLGLRPEQFFGLHPMPMNAGRVYILSGRGKTLAELYRKATSTPEGLIAISGSDNDFAMIAPYIALGLRQAGDDEEAAHVLVVAERVVTTGTIDRQANQQALLARIHAAQGKDSQALGELSVAVRNGWLPPAPQLPNDIALDPAFGSIRSDPRFEQLRRQILGHLARERAELGPVDLGEAIAPRRR